jgi:hypothetical protein
MYVFAAFQVRSTPFVDEDFGLSHPLCAAGDADQPSNNFSERPNRI